jgi:Methanol-cobalamin methyltransferase B subunit
MEHYKQLAIANSEELVFGQSLHPLRLKNGLTIGAGTVYPELNFTLPPMNITAETMPEVRSQYTQMIEGVCVRAVELQVPGLVVEFELLPDLTLTPEWGAVGPSKDCAYEGPYIKAITGYPIALEGAEAACAHSSPVGNIAKATPDLWSNESIQNIKLLGGMAPTVSLEQLAYATRLMNTASAGGISAALTLRDWFVESDSHLDPQAYVLRPDVVVQLAGEIIQEETHYRRTRRAALSTLEALRKAYTDGSVQLPSNEVAWLSRLSRQADNLPEDESLFLQTVLPDVDKQKIRLDQYRLESYSV